MGGLRAHWVERAVRPRSDASAVLDSTYFCGGFDPEWPKRGTDRRSIAEPSADTSICWAKYGAWQQRKAWMKRLRRLSDEASKS